MNKYLVTALLAMTVFLSSCEMIGDIFQAGLYIGIILVIIVVALIAWVIRKFRRRS